MRRWRGIRGGDVGDGDWSRSVALATSSTAVVAAAAATLHVGTTFRS